MMFLIFAVMAQENENRSQDNRSNILGHLDSGELKHVHQLSEPVALEVQNAYFKQSFILRAIGYNRGMDGILSPEAVLFDAGQTDANRRLALSLLGAASRVEAYRIIEDFLVVAPPGELRQWALMAQLEAKVGIMSYLTDERQIAVTSGLGGYDGRMRFMGLLHTRQLQPLEGYQRELLEKECRFRMESAKGILERFEGGENYLLITFLVPIKSRLKELFEGIVNECNRYGNFLSDSFLITNSEPIDEKTVQDSLDKYAKAKHLDATTQV